MRVGELGERRLVEELLRVIERPQGLLLPHGDDVAAIEVGGVKVALSCDMLVWDTDVPRGMSYWEVGRKAVVSCISDLAAKGARPIAVLLSIGVPGHVEVDQVVELVRGANDGAREHGAYLVGGDTNEAPTIVLDVACIGVAEHRLVPRGGARPGDIVAVTGAFGSTGAALAMALRGLKPRDPELERRLWEPLARPRARVAEGVALSRVATAAIDSSDGLAASLAELSRASGASIIVDYVPISSEAQRFAEEFNLDPLQLALYGGEEYELVVTIPPDRWSEAVSALSAMGSSLTRIGVVAEGEGVKLSLGGELREVAGGGWEHFRC